jgi:hypothetical protein
VFRACHKSGYDVVMVSDDRLLLLRIQQLSGSWLHGGGGRLATLSGAELESALREERPLWASAAAAVAQKGRAGPQRGVGEGQAQKQQAQQGQKQRGQAQQDQKQKQGQKQGQAQKQQAQQGQKQRQQAQQDQKQKQGQKQAQQAQRGEQHGGKQKQQR